MGTHPIFESDFDCLTEKMGDPDAVSIRSDMSVKSVNMYGSPVPDNVDSWSDVETLNLCFTGLKTTEKILKLKSLKRLYLRHNQIEDMGEIRKLKKLPKLTSLSLIGNPICKNADYRNDVLAALPELTILDGEILESDKSTTQTEFTKSLKSSEDDTLGPRKPNTVMAISLLLQELDNPSDLDEIKKTLKARLRKIKETDIFTV